MSRFACFHVVVCLLITAFSTIEVTAQEPPKPTDEHRVLAQDIGKWKTQVEMFIPGQDQPMKSEGTEMNELVCNGLFIRSVFKGDMGGMPFEGHSLMGYDTFQKKYTGIWVDNFGTSLYKMVGSYDAAKKIMTVNMTGPDPMSGKEMTMKSVTTYVDENKKTFEMFGADPTGQADGMMKMMSMKAVREK